MTEALADPPPHPPCHSVGHVDEKFTPSRGFEEDAEKNKIEDDLRRHTDGGAENPLGGKELHVNEIGEGDAPVFQLSGKVGPQKAVSDKNKADDRKSHPDRPPAPFQNQDDGARPDGSERDGIRESTNWIRVVIFPRLKRT